MPLTDEDLAPMAEIAAVANTPAYLYRRARREAVVQEFASRNAVDVLLRMLHDVHGSAPTGAQVLDPGAYMFLIAAMIRSDRDGLANMNAGDLHWLVWGAELMEIWRSTRKATSSKEVVMRLPRRFEVPSTSQVETPTSERRIILND